MIWWRFLRIYMILNKLKLSIDISKLIHFLFALLVIARLIPDRLNCFIISSVGLNCLILLFACIIIVLFCILIARCWYCFVFLRSILILFFLLIVWCWTIYSLLWRFGVFLIKTFRVMITSITQIISFLLPISMHILFLPTRSLILVQLILFAFQTHLFLMFLMILVNMLNLPYIASRILLMWVESWKSACIIALFSSIIITILLTYFLFVSRFRLQIFSITTV